jgi:hypothetical protein
MNPVLTASPGSSRDSRLYPSETFFLQRNQAALRRLDQPGTLDSRPCSERRSVKVRFLAMECWGTICSALRLAWSSAAVKVVDAAAQDIKMPKDSTPLCFHQLSLRLHSVRTIWLVAAISARELDTEIDDGPTDFALLQSSPYWTLSI